MKQKPLEPGRRQFLAGMVVAGSATTVIGALSPDAQSAAEADHTKRTPDIGSKGYQLTAHVEAYYRSLS